MITDPVGASAISGRTNRSSSPSTTTASFLLRVIAFKRAFQVSSWIVAAGFTTFNSSSSCLTNGTSTRRVLPSMIMISGFRPASMAFLVTKSPTDAKSGGFFVRYILNLSMVSKGSPRNSSPNGFFNWDRRWIGNIRLRGPFQGLSILPDFEGVLALLLDTHFFS